MMNPRSKGSPRDDGGTGGLEWILAMLVMLSFATIPLLVTAVERPVGVPRSVRSAPARDHHRVVLFIVDGLGTRRALADGAMPLLQARISTSAFGVAMAPFPTITPSGLRTILSGHPSRPQPEFPGGVRASHEEDSVLARATAAGLKTIVVGQFSWPSLFDGHGTDLRIVPYLPSHVLARPSIARDGSEPDGDYDVEVLRTAVEELSGRRKDWDLLVLHLFESDPIGHKFGTLSEEYRTHLLWVDRKIQEISDRLLAQAPTTFLLLADHGQEDDGSHGSSEPAVSNVPFMLWGDGIRPGSLGHLWLGCAAPTLAVLLGIPPPALADRWPLLDAIQLNEAQKTGAVLDLFRQRRERWTSTNAVWPWMGGDPYPDVRRMEALVAAGKNSAATRLGIDGIRKVEAILHESSSERWLGRFIAGFGCIVSAVLFNLVWPQARPWRKTLSVALTVVFACSLVTPLQWPWLWPTASGCALGAAALLLLLSVQSSYRIASGIDRESWLLLALCISGSGWGPFMDIRLWTWAAFLILLIRHIFRNRRIDACAAIGIVALLLCVAIAIDTLLQKNSTLRLWLPNRPTASISQLPWDWLQFLIIPALCVVVYVFSLAHGRWRDWRLATALAVPMCAIGFAMGVPGVAPGYNLWAWLAGVVSLVLATTWVSDPRTRAICWGLAALALYRTMAENAFQWSSLALAVLTVWGLLWDFAERHSLFQGLFIVTIGFWVYGIAGEEITFAHITVVEGQRLLGKNDYSSVLVAVIALKHLLAFWLVAFPWLVTRPFRTVMGALPFFGFFAAGNLTLMWVDHFVAGGNESRLTSHPGYAHCLFGLLLLCMLWALGTAFAMLDRLLTRRQIVAVLT